jgi:predicted ATPase
LFEGEAGIGKTTLWRAGVERARELGCQVLEARPASAERELSYAALGDLLAGMQDEIGGLPAPQRRALRIALVLEEADGEPADKRAIAAAVRELLRRLSAEAPLVVALDDIQWLDPPSAGARADRVEERQRLLELSVCLGAFAAGGEFLGGKQAQVCGERHQLTFESFVGVCRLRVAALGDAL